MGFGRDFRGPFCCIYFFAPGLRGILPDMAALVQARLIDGLSRVGGMFGNDESVGDKEDI